MRHKVAGRGFSRPTGHRLSLYRNLVSDVLMYEKIITTEAKAKEVCGMVDEIITLGKQNNVHARQRALMVLGDRKLVRRVFTELAPRYAKREGGYTRILKLGNRRGDGAPTAQLELVE